MIDAMYAALLNTQSHAGWATWIVEWQPGSGNLSIQRGADSLPDRSWELVSEDALINRS